MTRHVQRYTTGPDGKKIINRTYMTWKAMRQRCRDPKAWNYKYYGGRGIKYDPRWNDYALFLQDMGDRPEGMTLDRENSDGDYCKDNCRWATVTVQHDNMRPRKDGITRNGVTKSAWQWERDLGLRKNQISYRKRLGWREDELLLPIDANPYGAVVGRRNKFKQYHQTEFSIL